jgi:hypothetical protein
LQQLTKHKKIQQKGLSDFDQEAFFVMENVRWVME